MDRQFLSEAIKIARENIDQKGGPFGAVIVKEGEIIAKAGNRVTENNDPTAHAEILAIREASARLGNFNLKGCILYSSCEPCPMCLGAIYWARLDKVIFACDHEDAKAAGFDDTVIYREFAKPPGDRKLNMVQSQREEGLEVFRKWNEKPDKEEY